MGLTWLCSSGASVNAMAALVANESSRVSPGQVRSVYRFRVASELYGSYLTVQVTLRPRLQRATLVSPDGRQVELMPLLRRLPAEQAQQPEFGDVHVMTDVLLDPAPGQWQMVLDHAPIGTTHSISWQVVQQPRFAGNLTVIGGESLKVGVEADVVLALTDYGMPAASGRPGPLRVTASNGSQSTHAMSAGNSPGRFVARIPVHTLEPIELSVDSKLPLTGGPHNKVDSGWATVASSRRLAVSAGAVGSDGSASDPLLTVVERDARGCIQSVSFTLPWQANAVGTHVLSVSLGSGRRITGSVDVGAPGSTTLKAVLRGNHKIQFTPGLVSQAATVEVVLAVGAGPLLLRRSAVPLSVPFDPSTVCP